MDFQSKACLAPLSPSGDTKPSGFFSSALSFMGFFGRLRSLQNDEDHRPRLPPRHPEHSEGSPVGYNTPHPSRKNVPDFSFSSCLFFSYILFFLLLLFLFRENKINKNILFKL
jgi:hypothetical protein